MEPSSVEDGNEDDSEEEPIETKLQWSRPQLRTETHSARCTPCGTPFASMEPSSVEDGNTRLPLSVAVVSSLASMEPSSVEDGNNACELEQEKTT